MSNIETILIPDIGDFKDVPVIEMLVKPGDMVAADETLLVLESDKATLDVPSPTSGIVREVIVQPGDKVSCGSPFLKLEISEGAASAVTEPPAQAAPAVAPPQPQVASAPPPSVASAAPTDTASGATSPTIPHAPPSVRRFARELGADLTQVTGTGAKGRISREDVQAWVKDRVAGASAPAAQGSGLGLLPWPQVDFAKFGPVERAPLSKIRRISGANLQRNAILIPQVTNFDEADVTDLEAFRQMLNNEAKDGTKLTLLPFVIKAAVAALKAHPTFNASLDGEELILKRYYHIGFAADTPEGLVVPVIKDADRKGLVEISQEAVQLAADARQGKLKLGDMQGATFTISSLGGVGGTNFTPIINAPEVAILGMTRAQTKPVWDGSAFHPRLVQPVSLSWDHRVVDGVAAARFLVTLCQLLSDFRRIAL
ncbi:dihydrolipoyllysine-residue acetyltransferase [Sphingobium sp. SA916]|uniref:dihydrolipoyllysine-residue acetyltransferase n=1 Tax=Sphingobium sp. SA916 TaxID=1851207 RepID=UPI000C9F3333|nr:dihydrolipoyllysine-residue acetyltransferase [Sphingobium sp. SA916]PNQ03974.1 dihydrolipoyllysine-residue acetyltransferase [Sphingobium sp. SA916]